MELRALLHRLIEQGGSDLHLIPGSPPRIRIDGRLTSLEDPPLTPLDTQHVIEEWLTPSQGKQFEESKDLDCSLQIQGCGRFRCHVYRERGDVALAIRAIPIDIPTVEHLGLPRILGDFVTKPRGLLLVTGQTGSGKSTTVAALIDKVNHERRGHVVTIEDPIEFLHSHHKSVVTQREVGTDTPDYPSAIRAVFRQDPDLVFLGEMRDRETVEAGLTLAETGHLTLATVHTNSSVQTIHRIVDVFPGHQQPQVRAQLALVLEGIVSQTLVSKREGSGRVLALEILVPTTAIRNLIREDKIHQIYSVMQTGQAKHGMQTMNQALVDLYRQGLISGSAAMARTSYPDELKGLMERAGYQQRLR